jgi:arylsulfatase A-like enzyme
MKSLLKAACAVLAASASTLAVAAPPQGAKRPNVVIIVADDLGFSDLGAFGGEIRTPNLDKLAQAGLRLTDFHSSPTCSPTRSMLLSGTDNHTAGVGAMAEMTGSAAPRWGYEGVLTPRVATLAERLAANGYFTTMSGKWHLGLKPQQDPHARGFATSFALLQGASNHFGGGFGPDDNPNLSATYTQNGKPVALPQNFYSSDTFTTRLIDQLGAAPKDKPFLAYLAFTAPHSPLQAPASDIARYKGRYDKGWVALRAERLARMKSLGLIPANTVPAPFADSEAAWNRLTPEQKKIEARKMEIYAAMVDRLDQNVGRLVAHLKATGAYDNTLFFFTADNGAAGEGAELFGRLPGMAAYLATRDNSYEKMGSKESTIFYGPHWAQAATSPSRFQKGVITEGGTRVAAFVTYAGLARQSGSSAAMGDVMDVVPTLLDFTGTAPTDQVAGRQVAPIRGTSMMPYLSRKAERVHPADEAIVFELHGQRAVRQGSWKLVWLTEPWGKPQWALYDLASDPGEQTDLSARYPERKQALTAAWTAFAKETQIPDLPPAAL